MERWAKFYDECICCHSTAHSHKARGLCISCYKKQLGRKHAQESKCRICGAKANRLYNHLCSKCSHKTKGKICPVCGVLICDTAQTCLEHPWFAKQHADWHNPIVQQILWGTLAGDAYLSIVSDETARLSISHSIRQQAYLNWKRKWLKGNISAIIARCQSGEFPAFRLNTHAHPYLRDIYGDVYVSGTKTISQSWLDRLDDLGWLIWYLDDGNLHLRSFTMRLFTMGYGQQGCELIQQVLWNKCQIKAMIKHAASGPYLYLTRRESLIWSNRLFPIFQQMELPKEMLYKLGEGETNENRYIQGVFLPSITY